MPVQNISAQLTAQQFTDLKAAIQALSAMFPALVTMTDAERSSLQRVGSGRETFCETALAAASNFPTIVPSYVSVAEWNKDETYFAQLGEAEGLIAVLRQKIDDTRAVVGSERYRQARKIYDAVKSAKEDVPGLQATYDTLSEQFDGQGPTGGQNGGNGGNGGGGGGNP